MNADILRKTVLVVLLGLILLLAVTINQEPEQPTQEEPEMTDNPQVTIQTSLGNIQVELYPQEAPVTVQNFLDYVEADFYEGTVFHRVIEGFMVQGGGFTPDGAQKETNPAIELESDNGLLNERGTIAMARTSVPDSATSQFFINHADNDFLNRAPGNAGYAVFGNVTEGMDVVDAIAAVQTGSNPMPDWPVEPVIIESISRT